MPALQKEMNRFTHTNDVSLSLGQNSRINRITAVSTSSKLYICVKYQLISLIYQVLNSLLVKLIDAEVLFMRMSATFKSHIS